MLQQTRVGTVAPYYRRWMERFPDVVTLADADQDDVMRLWSGLGYYARARNAHRSARMVRGRTRRRLSLHRRAVAVPAGGGSLHRRRSGEHRLRRAGPRRLTATCAGWWARLYDLPDPSLAKTRDRVAGLMDTARPGDFNEAMMELGATVCTPRSPSCGTCPLAAGCRARIAGTVAERPVRRRRGPLPVRAWGVLVAVSPGGRTLLVRRPPDGLLGGMWEFPGVELDGDDAGRRLVRRRVARLVLAGGDPRPSTCSWIWTGGDGASRDRCGPQDGGRARGGRWRSGARQPPGHSRGTPAGDPPVLSLHGGVPALAVRGRP